jgi:hypothetical protein
LVGQDEWFGNAECAMPLQTCLKECVERMASRAGELVLRLERDGRVELFCNGFGEFRQNPISLQTLTALIQAYTITSQTERRDTYC